MNHVPTANDNQPTDAHTARHTGPSVIRRVILIIGVLVLLTPVVWVVVLMFQLDYALKHPYHRPSRALTATDVPLFEAALGVTIPDAHAIIDAVFVVRAIGPDRDLMVVLDLSAAQASAMMEQVTKVSTRDDPEGHWTFWMIKEAKIDLDESAAEALFHNRQGAGVMFFREESGRVRVLVHSITVSDWPDGLGDLFFP
jgi:hypothetical protein